MNTKDIIILAALLALSGFSLYRKYKNKSGNAPGRTTRSFTTRSNIRDQADDYEPYSGDKSTGD